MHKPSWRLITLLLLALPFAAAAQAPYLTHVSDTPPGYTMVLSGGDFNPATVQVVLHVPGWEVKQRPDLPKLVGALAETYTGRPLPLPATPPKDQTYTLKPLSATARSVFVTLPQFPGGGKNFPPGFTALVWLKDGGQLSNPLAVNRPQGWALLHTTSRPGELNRLTGFNLKADPYVPNYVFLRPAGGGAPVVLEQVERHAEVYDTFAPPFCVQFRIPASLKAGDYEVFAHNNSGAAYGFTAALPLKVVTEPDFPARVYVATEHGVKGDSVTDDLPALQTIMDQAGAEGGGVIYLPAGSYRLNDTLQFRANVTLRGAGRETTTIFFGDTPDKPKRAYWFLSARGVDHTALEDLTVRTTYPMTLALSYYKQDTSPTYDSAIRRVHFQGGGVSMHNAVSFEIGNCFFESGGMLLNNLEHAWIHDNEYTTGRLRGSPFAVWASQNSTFEQNRVFGSDRGFVWQLAGYFGHYHNFIDANVVEGDRMANNAGETYLFEGSGFKWWGAPTTIAAAGFTVDDAKWKPDALKHAFAVVTDGRGVGEYVRIASNTATEVTLEQPWPVRPADATQITIMYGVVENVLVNNREVDCDNSLMFFGAGAINNRIVRHRSENTIGISLWSWCVEKEHTLIPDYYNIFETNVLEDQGGFWMTVLGDIQQTSGVRNLNNIYRDNFVSDTRRKRENQYHAVWDDLKYGGYRPIQAAFWLDIGRSYEKDRTQTPIWIDTLIERNYVTRTDWGVELRKIAGGTVVNANTFFDVKLPVIDQGSGTRLLDNRLEQPVLENPPAAAPVDRPQP